MGSLKSTSAFYTIFAAVLISACTGTSSISSSTTSSGSSASTSNVSSDTTSMGYDDLPTPFTDAFKLTTDFEGLSFVDDGIGLATLRSTTDGDTASFDVAGFEEVVRLRFLGINTPESTAAIEPWGTKASSFTKSKLENATSIVLLNDISIFNQTDSNGRFLGFIWYQPTAEADYRLLNLEIVEQCYSRNLLFLDSVLANYRPTFAQAGEAASATGRRVYGQLDPDYDYSGAVIEDITIRDIRENYSNYGVIEGGSSGLQLRLTALVVGMIGDNMILRDIQNPYLDGTYAGVYAFAGYGSALATKVSIGYVVKFYCRATMFLGNIQLSDLKTLAYGSFPFQILERPTQPGYNRDYSPVTFDGDSVGVAEFNESVGYYIATEVTVTTVDGVHYKSDECTNLVCSMTIYAETASGVILNLRFDASMSPRVYGPSFQQPEVFMQPGTTYHVEGYLTPYYGNYQLMLFNNISGQNYIYSV